VEQAHHVRRHPQQAVACNATGRGSCHHPPRLDLPCPAGDILVVKFGDIVPADLKILGDEEDEEEIPMQARACDRPGRAWASR
jgi:hypothetical protein